MEYQDLGLAGLVNLEDWQKIQDLFSEVLEITLRTVSVRGEPLTTTSRLSRMCSEILPGIPRSNELCGYCILTNEKKLPDIDIKKKNNFKCTFGLDIFTVPIVAVGNRTAAFIILGPVILKSRKTESEYAKDAGDLGIRLDILTDALIEINVFSYNKIHNIIKMVKNIFSYMAETGYHKKRLGEIAPKVLEMDPVFSRYYEEKILGSLLNASSRALNADSGSVMTLDKHTNILHIKAASNLAANIIKKTNVKMGESIAGLAAKTANPIILPKDADKNNLSSKMKRSDIKSSMIVPFNKWNTHDVYGVINLNIVRRNRAFSENDIQIVKELVKMASIALLPLYQERAL